MHYVWSDPICPRHPSASGDIVTAWTVAIPAGVISFFQMTACVTDFPVSAELSTSTVFNVVHNLVLPGVKAVCCPEGRAVFPGYITYGRTGCCVFREFGMTAKCSHGFSKPIINVSSFANGFKLLHPPSRFNITFEITGTERITTELQTKKRQSIYMDGGLKMGVLGFRVN